MVGGKRSVIAPYTRPDLLRLNKSTRLKMTRKELENLSKRGNNPIHGSTHVKTVWISLAGSLSTLIMCRRKIKSKSELWTHSSSISSTVKFTLGGSQVGCMGDKSVPNRTAWGNISPTIRSRIQSAREFHIQKSRFSHYLQWPKFLCRCQDP